MTDKATIDSRIEKLLVDIDVFVSTEPNMDNKRKMDVYVKNIKSLLLEVVREVVGDEEKSEHQVRWICVDQYHENYYGGEGEHCKNCGKLLKKKEESWPSEIDEARNLLRLEILEKVRGLCSK